MNLYNDQRPTRWVPRRYMKKAVRFLLEHACAALFLDPGMGKTSITFAALLLLFKKLMISKVLVIAPLRVCFAVWPKEAQKWVDFHGLRLVVLHGPKKAQLLEAEADIFLINPEGLPWLLGVEKSLTPSGKMRVDVDYKRWKSLGFDVLVVDELTKFKHTSSQRFKALKLVHHTFGRRWGLTGSPAANGLEDLFAQAYILDQGRSLGPYITHYRRQFFDLNDDGISYRLKSGAEDQIYRRIAPLALRMNSEDYLELPMLVTNKIMVELDDEARRIYDAMEDDLIAQIRDKLVVASNSAVASGKCRQLTGGAIYQTVDVTELIKTKHVNREWIDVHSEKLDALESLVDELQHQPLLVGYEFSHELERLRSRFPDAVFVKDVKPSSFSRLEDRWNNGEIELLIGQVTSLYLGLNLQGCGEHLCFYTTPWDYEVYDQLISRLRRQGSQARRIMVHHLLAEHTVDQQVMTALARKEKGQRALFDALVELAKTRRSH